MRVRFPNGPDQIEGELVLPPTEGSHPGIVLIPDVGGLSELYVGFAQRLAQAGFAALALNPYSRGEQPDLSNLEAIFKFLAELPDRQVLSDVQAALDYLTARPETRGRRLGVTGFCVGGQYTILAACSLRGLSAAVAWYGMLRVSRIDECNPEHPLDALPRLAARCSGSSEKTMRSCPTPMSRSSGAARPAAPARWRQWCTPAPGTPSPIPDDPTPIDRRQRATPGSGCWPSSTGTATRKHASGRAKAGRLLRRCLSHELALSMAASPA